MALQLACLRLVNEALLPKGILRIVEPGLPRLWPWPIRMGYVLLPSPDAECRCWGSCPCPASFGKGHVL